jgi:hypothetical protein
MIFWSGHVTVRRTALVLLAALAALATCLLPSGTATSAAAPLLVLTPDRGPCGTTVVARGANFPSQVVRFYVSQVGSDNAAETPDEPTPVAPDGTFAAAPRLLAFACGSARPPDGTQIRVTAVAVTGPGKPADDAPRAQAIFTLTSAVERCFAETGFCVGRGFLSHWEGHGLDLGDPGVSARESLALFGYPISGEFSQALEDGRQYTVQYFERARFEYHPENTIPHDVQLGQFGRRILRERQGYEVAPRADPRPDADYFPETGHNLRGWFRDYWRQHGGLAQFGYPLTEEFVETLEDGRPYLVQYFERVRFEYHPEHDGTPYDILLGLFGRHILTESRR